MVEKPKRMTFGGHLRERQVANTVLGVSSNGVNYNEDHYEFKLEDDDDI